MPTLAEDRDEIRDLFARYCTHIDTGTPEEWAELFTTDGEFGGMGEPTVGREGLLAFAKGIAGGGGGMHHMVMNEVIDVEGDRATSRASIVVVAGGTVAVSGRYEDVLRRVDGRWRIAKRTFHPDARPS